MSEKLCIHKRPHVNGKKYVSKFHTLCGKLARFDAVETAETPATCKVCIKIENKTCPTCSGTGLKNGELNGCTGL